MRTTSWLKILGIVGLLASAVGTAAAQATVTITGRALCAPIPRPPSTTAGTPVALPGVAVTIAGVTAISSGTGNFLLTIPAPTGSVTAQVRYAATVPTAAGPATLAVTDELRAPRADTVSIALSPNGGPTTVRVSSVDCETYLLARGVLLDFIAVTGGPPPGGGLAIRRWTTLAGAGVIPYTDFDWITVGADWVLTSGSAITTLFHEFGHRVRHAHDGDGAHFAGDVIRYAYARIHGGCETFQQGFAFNEGWGGYWQHERLRTTPSGCVGQAAAFVDWTEDLITARLLALAAAISPSSNVRAAAMMAVSASRPGRIHTLRDFELAYCAMVTAPATMCAGGMPLRPAPAACPPGWTDDGATCRLDRSFAKQSIARGAGTPPTGCGPGQSFEAGLCYAACPAGFIGAGLQCVEACPAGFRDDGLYCAKPSAFDRPPFGWQLGDPIGDLAPARNRCLAANPGGCEQGGLMFYRTCPAGFRPAATLCSPTCPATMRDIGVSCAKRTTGRGAGTVPTGCTAGRVLDTGLCYASCPAGATGVGPLCWPTCPIGFEDHGATCYQVPFIIAK